MFTNMMIFIKPTQSTVKFLLQLSVIYYKLIIKNIILESQVHTNPLTHTTKIGA